MSSFRAKSLRNVVVNSLYFVLWMGLLAASATIAQGQDAVSEDPVATELGADVKMDRRLTDDHIDSQLNTDDNMPSGTSNESAADERQTIMLGMKLVERREGDIRVADVTAASPAWEAGIRRGDRLLSVDNVKPVALARWVDDLSKILEDREDGKGVATEIDRDGERLSLRIRLPESRAAEARVLRQEQEALADMGQRDQVLMQQGQQTVPVAVGQDGTAGYGLGGWGLGGFFDENGTDDRMANAAVAQLMAVNTFSNTNTGNANMRTQATTNQSAVGAGGQVGIAAFQNNGQGVTAVVAVRGLPQGSYIAGIDQGGALTGGFGGAGALGDDSAAFDNGQSQFDTGIQNNRQLRNDRRQQNQPGLLERQRMQDQGPNQQFPAGQPQPVSPGQGLPNGPNAMPGEGAAPAGSGAPTGGAGAAGGSGQGASLANPRNNGVLAQQLDPQQTQGTQQSTTGQGAVSGQAGTRQMRQINGPANRAGAVDPRQNLSRGNMNGNQSSANGLENNGQDLGTMGNPGSQFVTQIGVLHVGPDGSGRIQNQLEGMQVQNLAGMSVTIVSTMSQGGGYDPNQAVDPRKSGGQPGRNPQRNNLGGVSAAQNSGGLGIVATGVIQVMEGNQIPGLGFETGNQQEPVDEATREQRNRSTISPPDSQFPSR